ncbi:uncharacterized protein LOC9631411 [Selaginella moellendorffii]|uniref:uncharacterized protein LOC9631411 n=1 Tax=Selaginella moellendorffii TaxID=88036 RepID=UPI000D1D0977|nr:uncharacterized protein LOC9631411 [Selaginella moellendorffii]|eukprot:XP_024529252.1 uncharacterized protein LOC9631411 [Selaginella moellendorffii]
MGELLLARPLVVVGSANADMYVELDRMPKEGETLAARNGQTLPGGKGANQAACAARLSFPTFFVGQVGKDGNATMLRDALQTSGVRLDYLNTVSGPTGHAIVMLQPNGLNSIVIVGGANTAWKKRTGSSTIPVQAEETIRKAGALLLQREIPDDVNIEAAKIAREADIPVIMDAGGFDSPIPEELLKYITVLSPNETELARLTSMPTETTQEVVRAANKCLDMGVKQVLVKRGVQGSMLAKADESPILQPAIPAPAVVDTTGAGDTFTAAFTVAILEGKEPAEALRFAAAAASVCVRAKGAIPSMPNRKAVDEVLKHEQYV